MASTLACWSSFIIAFEGPLVTGAGCTVDVEDEGGEGDAGAGEGEGGEGDAGAGEGGAASRVVASRDETAGRAGEREDRARVVAAFDVEAPDVKVADADL